MKKMTKEQSKDTGMAMALLLMLVFLKTHRIGWLDAAIVVQVVDMVWPQIFAPVAIIWFGLSHILGTIMSRILLSILFFGLVTPVGLIRRLLGKDSLKLKAFKAGRDSAMVTRNHLFVAKDIERPY